MGRTLSQDTSLVSKDITSLQRVLRRVRENPDISRDEKIGLIAHLQKAETLLTSFVMRSLEMVDGNRSRNAKKK